MSRQRADRDRAAPGGQRPLRMGVIGLGAGWRHRYRPALAALPRHFSVHVVCDQVPRRAEAEARALDCAVAAGPMALLEENRVDAFLMCDPQWYGLWPLELACRTGKPVLCAPSLEVEDARADDLLRQVRESRVPVLAGMAPRLAPATGHLRQLLETDLGPPRLLLCEVMQPARRTARPSLGRTPDLLLGPEGLTVLDWLAGLLGGAEPVAATAVVAPAADFVSVLLEFGGGRAAQINRHRTPGARPAARLRVVAERGQAVLRLPDRVSWSGPDGLHQRRLQTGRTLVQALLLHFAQAVRAGQPARPNLEDAFRALRWLRLARRSLAEGRRIAVADTP